MLHEIIMLQPMAIRNDFRALQGVLLTNSDFRGEDWTVCHIFDMFPAIRDREHTFSRSIFININGQIVRLIPHLFLSYRVKSIFSPVQGPSINYVTRISWLLESSPPSVLVTGDHICVTPPPSFGVTSHALHSTFKIIHIFLFKISFSWNQQ